MFFVHASEKVSSAIGGEAPGALYELNLGSTLAEKLDKSKAKGYRSAMACRIYMLDGNFKEFASPPSGLQLAQSISPGLAQRAVGLLLNGEDRILDIRSALKDGDRAEIITLPSEKSLEVIRHSSAHVMAQAAQNLWPEAKVTIGPVIEDGFYYDFDTDKTFGPKDLEQIEAEMKSLLKQKYPLQKEIWSKEKALSWFDQKGELLKKEIIEGLPDEEISIYRQGPWLDLCRGPHVQHLGQIGAVKVLSCSGAYWRGDSSGKALQRIYGTAFHTEKQLKAFLKKRDQALKNDHRALGKKLDLFWFSDLSPGQPFFTPSGAQIYRRLQDLLREKYQKYGYEEVISPQIFSGKLFEKSGHLQHFAKDMYPVLDSLEPQRLPAQPHTEGKSEPQGQNPSEEANPSGALYKDEEKSPQGFPSQKAGGIKGYSFLKPMNCPGHCLLYKKERKSYRNLPWRVADFGRLHRRESGGSLHGLTRVRSFCQDDAHIFCRLDQLSDEIQTGIKMLDELYSLLGLSDYKIDLSTRPAQRMGEDQLWDQAEGALADSLKSLKIPYSLNPGDGAFYGPKLDICVKDSFGRSWQLGTFQCDFNLPKAFDLTYVTEEDRLDRPVMVHRALLGSLERFFGLYLEHCQGRLPAWLSPAQAVVLPLTDREKDFSLKIQKKLEQGGIVCRVDFRNEKLSFKIRESQNRQIPCMLIVGPKETQSQSLSVRLRTGEQFSGLALEDFSIRFSKEIKNRALRSFLLEGSA